MYDFSESEGMRTVYDREFIEEYKGILGILSDRERQVFEMYYGIINDNPRTLQIVGDQFRITRERSRQIILKAERKLMRKMNLLTKIDEKNRNRLKPKHIS